MTSNLEGVMNQNAAKDGLHDAQHMLGNRNPYNKGSASFEAYEKAYADNQPKFSVPTFVLDNCFHRQETPDGLIFWRECVGDGQDAGYMILYPDGNHLHTYKHPHTIWSL
jgi:hypothetical protein